MSYIDKQLDRFKAMIEDAIILGGVEEKNRVIKMTGF